MKYFRSLSLMAILLTSGLASAAASMNDTPEKDGAPAQIEQSGGSGGCNKPCGCNNPCPCEKTCACDKTPPTVIVEPPVELWPPNHKYHTFDLSDCVKEVKDNCDKTIDVNADGHILSIYSDEPENSVGDGNTTDDIVILGDSSFKLRSERQGGGNGRVYGVSFAVSDNAGNTTKAICYFAVPHDQSGAPAVDDGPGAGYTVF